MNAHRKALADLRSQRWFAPEDLRSFGHRSRALQMGYEREDFMDKPIVAIINTWSDLQPCHQHFKARVEHVKRGIWQAGGFPVELPALSLSESFTKPSTMLYRNLLALETEELLRQHPVDGAVLMGGCDKTTPATIMGAISMNLPVIFMPAGPMMRGHFGGQDSRERFRHLEVLRRERGRETSPKRQWKDMEGGNRALGRHLHDHGDRVDDDVHRRGAWASRCRARPPYRPADAAHSRMAMQPAGKRIVEMVWEDLKPSDIITQEIRRERAHDSQRPRRFDERDGASRPPWRNAAASTINLTDFDDFAAQKVPVICEPAAIRKEWLMEDYLHRWWHPGAVVVTPRTRCMHLDAHAR